MDEAEYEEGEYIITQGEEGDKFYLLVEGGAVARIRLPAGEKEVKWYKKGGYFGEVALMRDEPRAASIVATTRSKCAFLQKQRFQDLMQLHKRLRERLEAVLVNYSSVKPQKAFEDLLASVPLLSGLELGERQEVARAMTSKFYAEGDYIITQGDRGDSFFVLEEGTAVASLKLPGHEDEKVVAHYTRGGYFGERSLLMGEPRSANVIATSTARCASMDKETFARLCNQNPEMRIKVEAEMGKYAKASQKASKDRSGAASALDNVARASGGQEVKATAYIQFTEHNVFKKKQQVAAVYNPPYGDPTVFVTHPEERFLCPVCRDVFQDPQIASDGVTYCRACIPEFDALGNAVRAVGRDNGLYQKILGLKIICKHGLAKHKSQWLAEDKEGEGEAAEGLLGGADRWHYDHNGCKAILDFANREEHEKNCNYAHVRCNLPGSMHDTDNCIEQVRKVELLVHRQICLHRTQSCVYCKKSIQMRHYTAHLDACTRRPINCPCGWKGSFAEYLDHKGTCRANVVVCGQEDTETLGACREVYRRELAQEHNKVCQFKPVQCEDCGQFISRYKMPYHQQAMCRHRHLACDRCGARVHYALWDEHRAEDCTGETFECSFKPYGCAARLTSGEIAKHAEVASPYHLRLLMARVLETRDELHTYYEDLSVVDRTLRASAEATDQDHAAVSGALDALEAAAARDLEAYRGKVAELEGFHRRQEGELRAKLDTAVEESERTLQQLEEENRALLALLKTKLSQTDFEETLESMAEIEEASHRANGEARDRLAEQQTAFNAQLADAVAVADRGRGAELRRTQEFLADLEWLDAENTGACDRALGEFTGDVGAWVDELTGAFLLNTSRTEAVEGLHGNLDNTLKHIQEADWAKYTKAARAVRARVLAARDGN